MSDIFDQFMERAAVEAELATAGMCRETREVWAVSTPTIPRGGITEVSSSYKPLLGTGAATIQYYQQDQVLD